jgi:hypothetical protein
LNKLVKTMAEKTIGIRIQLNGLNTVITDIQTLENEIRKAKEDLKQVEIGGPIFKQLAKEISQAETKLMGLQDAARGISKEKTLEGFGKLGAGISSSFAAATAAVSLFGKESESVQKAAIQAQNLLTIALSIRGIAEVKTGAQIVAKTIAEKASTAATLATNGATKALYTTLAANPYGAILAAVGLLITAYLTLTTATYDAEEAQNSYNKVLEDTLYGYDIERATIEANAAIKIKNAELEGKSITEIAAIKKQANLDTIALIDREVDDLVRLRIERQKEISANIKDEKERKAAIKKLNEDFTKEGRRLGLESFKLEQQLKLDEIDLQIQLKNNTQKTTEARKKYIETLLTELEVSSKLVVQNINLTDVDNKILDSLQKKVEAAKSYANELDRLKTFTQLYKEELNDLNPVQDSLGDIFNYVKGTGENLIDSLDGLVYSAAQSKEALQDFDDGIKILSQGLNETDQQLLLDFASNYKELFTTFQMLQKFSGKPLGFKIDDFQKVVTDLNLLSGKITEDPYKRSAEEIVVAKVTAQERYNILKKSFNDEYIVYLEAQERKKGLSEKEIADSRVRLEAISTATFESLTGVGDNLLKFEQGVVLTSKKVIELNKQLQALAPAARAGFIVQNADEIAAQYGVTIPLVLRNEKELSNLQGEIAKKTFDEKKKYAEAINILQADLLAQGIDIESLSYEQKLLLLEKFLGKSVAATTKAAEDTKKATKTTVDAISEGLEQFSMLVGRTASLVAQSYAFQLQQLEKTSKDALSKVTGDTEEANKKRLELESQYQKEKAQIEKAALIKSLQFQLVQAIVDTAQAVTANLEVPPLAIAVGILGAIQVALIGQQLNAAQALAGGGRIRMGAGGMVMGPSHENGGVSFASGGVNLEGGESVINRQSSMNYGGLLSSINQMGGGQPLVNNPSNSLSEERLVQAIAKSRQEPIRAYVMNSEITNGQAINRRLEQLSTI